MDCSITFCPGHLRKGSDYFFYQSKAVDDLLVCIEGFPGKAYICMLHDQCATAEKYF